MFPNLHPISTVQGERALSGKAVQQCGGPGARRAAPQTMELSSKSLASRPNRWLIIKGFALVHRKINSNNKERPAAAPPFMCCVNTVATPLHSPVADTCLTWEHRVHWIEEYIIDAKMFFHLKLKKRKTFHLKDIWVTRQPQGLYRPRQHFSFIFILLYYCIVFVLLYGICEGV